ncbi:hypothetical protein BGZ46_002055 [Entomortierella lignicola]|nr:hypothetical protein BGZ46_002055 [Entomortierella lignicola]
MGYEYILIVAAILIPLGLFSVFRGEHNVGAHSIKKNSIPGAFADSTSSKSKKKKPKKKSTTAKSNSQTPLNAAEKEQDSSESEVEIKPVAQPTKKNNVTISTTAKTKSGKDIKDSANAIRSSKEAPISKINNDISNKSNNKDSAVNSPTILSTSENLASNTNRTSKPTSVENWKKQKQEQQKEILSKQQENLQFASAAARNASSSDSSPHITSIPGPGAMGNNKKKNRANAGSGLSHAEFPALSRPAPTPAPPKQPKQPKQPTQKKAPVKKPEPESEPEISQSEEEEEEEREEDNELQHQASDSDNDAPRDDKEEEWTTVNSTNSRSGGIDFSKPMDPWVAQQQRQRLERISAADPHVEQTERFARVLSIKPTVKEESVREAIPDGFQTQKSRSGGSSSGSSHYQSEELTKKQRENLAKAAKKKEEKAAMDAMQEKRRLEHMRQVKSEKMKEFYRAQTKKQTPVESRWDIPKTSASSQAQEEKEKRMSNSDQEEAEDSVQLVREPVGV